MEPTYIECGICREWLNCSDERPGPLLLRFEGVDDMLQVAVLLSHVAWLHTESHANLHRRAFADDSKSVKRKASDHLHKVLAALPPFHIRRSMEFLCVLLRTVAWLCFDNKQQQRHENCKCEDMGEQANNSQITNKQPAAVHTHLWMSCHSLRAPTD